MNQEANLLQAMRDLHMQLEDVLCSCRHVTNPNAIGPALAGLATCLEGWCRIASNAPDEGRKLIWHGGRLYEPLDLLKDTRERKAFQLRILAEESRSIRGEPHQVEYLDRVRSLLEDLHSRSARP